MHQTPAEIAATKAYEQHFYETAVTSLQSNTFVLEANRVFFHAGQCSMVNSATNFIKMDHDDITVQLAFDNPSLGANGLGGITLSGRPSNVKLKVGKDGSMLMSMDVHGKGKMGRVYIDMPAGSNYCTATVTDNFSSGEVSFSGYLYAPKDSYTYEGMES